MCGRYLRRSDKQRITEYFRVHGVAPSPLPADFNVAPTTHQPVIRLNRDTGERELVLMRWGLVPHHAGSLAEYKAVSTINARAENVQKGIWKRLSARHRCLVPADGFYEWQKSLEAPASGRGKPRTVRRPYAFTLRDGLPMAFAGLWDAWRDPAAKDGEWLQSFAIITTDANAALEPVHDRMPVILEPGDYDRWLDRSEERPLPLDLLRPCDPEAIASRPANPAVGSAARNGPEMLEWHEGLASQIGFTVSDQADEFDGR